MKTRDGTLLAKLKEVFAALRKKLDNYSPKGLRKIIDRRVGLQINKG